MPSESSSNVSASISLQVNVAPSDFPYAALTLEHQLRTWGAQVSTVIYTLDLRRSPGPRGARFDELARPMHQLIDTLAARRPTYHVSPIDYGDAAVKRVSDLFFGGTVPPFKDFVGAPFFGYFFGLASVESDYVLHLDCDILFGGGSDVWLRDAIDLLRERPEALFVCPLPGPPTSNGRLPRSVRRTQARTQEFGSAPHLERRSPLTYRLQHVSSRIFFTDLRRLRQAAPLAVVPARPWSYGSESASSPFLPAETCLSRAMKARGLVRLDYLGTDRGMWFLHPAQRGPTFVANLSRVITELEAGRIREDQRGRGELTDEWLNAVGPERYVGERPLLTARRVARAAGAVKVRDAARRLRWRQHDR